MVQLDRLTVVPAPRLDCEIIQYVSGLTRVGERLLVSYGVNGCESKVFELTLRDVRADLQPMRDARSLRMTASAT